MNKGPRGRSAKIIKGKVKQAVGMVVRDAKHEAAGKADKVAGEIQIVVGGLKDAQLGK